MQDNLYLVDLLERLLRRNPTERPAAVEVLVHPWFTSLDLLHQLIFVITRHTDIIETLHLYLHIKY